MTSSDLTAVTSHGAWAFGTTWTLKLDVASSDSQDRLFSMAGGGGFLIFAVSANYVGPIQVTDDIAYAAPDTRLEYRGTGTTGAISFSNVRFMPGDCTGI